MFTDLVKAFDDVLANPAAKFKESVDVSINLDFGKKKLNGLLRGSVVLPHTTGRIVRVAAFVDKSMEKDILQAGADIADSELLSEELSKGVVNYDIYLTTPSMVRFVSKFAKLLGPKGLMPSVKSNTILEDLLPAIQGIKSGTRLEYKSDRYGGINIRIGDMTSESIHLAANLKALLAEVMLNKPEGVTKMILRSLYVSSTMGTSRAISPAAVTS